MKKNFLVAGLLLAAVLMFSGCCRADAIADGNFGDAKFYDVNRVILSDRDDGRMKLCHLADRSLVDLGVNSAWIGVYAPEGLVVYGNEDGELGLCHVTDDEQVDWQRIVLTDDDGLYIDPAIAKMDGVYYMTATHQRGIVNQSDPDGENGHYTISLYRSEDLTTWTKVSDVVDQDKNSEDVELSAEDGVIRVTYEQEIADRKASTLNTCVSEDGGRTWQRQRILANGGDNEMAVLTRDGEDYLLYYSSDYEDVGSSYTGASAYLCRYDKDFNIRENRVLNTKNKTGIRFYDVIQSDEGLQILYAYDYLNENLLVYEIMK